MSGTNTALAVGTATAITNPDLIAKGVVTLSSAAETIISNTGNLIDGVLNTSKVASDYIAPLAATYGGVKGAEFIDDKLLHLENKYGKFLFKALGGLLGIANTPTAAVIGTGIAGWKGLRWTGRGVKKISQDVWNKGFSKNT